MPSSASRWSWAKLTMACGATLAAKLTRTSSGTKLRSLPAGVAFAVPAAAAADDPGGCALVTAIGLGTERPGRGWVMIGWGRCGRNGRCGGFSPPRGGGSTTMREPTRRTPQLETREVITREVWRWFATAWAP